MQVINYSQFLLENSSYEQTSWTATIDGREITITIQDVQDYLDSNSVTSSNMPINKIFHMCIHKNKKDEATIKRSAESDLRFPIIIAKNSKGKYSMILDGHHRLLKAKNIGKKTIRARILDLKKAPNYFKLMFE